MPGSIGVEFYDDLTRFREKTFKDPQSDDVSPGLISEHSQVKVEALGTLEFNFCEVAVGGIQQYIPFATNGRGGYKQGQTRCIPNPFIPKVVQGFISGRVPVR